MTARTLSRVTGSLVSMSLAMGPVVCLWTRAMYRDICSAPCWDQPICLPSDSCSEVLFWKQNFDNSGYPIWTPSPKIEVLSYSDASGLGWGGFAVHINGKLAVGSWSEEESGRSSTFHELRAIQYVLESYSDNLRGKEVCHRNDNRNAEIILSVGSQIPDLHRKAVLVYKLCRELKVKELNDYLINTTDRLRNDHPDHGLVLLGDFNDFDCGNLVSHHSLKQVVQQPTRDSAILDLIVTNMHNLYSSPTIHAPLDSSDHNIVFWQPIALRQPSRIKSPKRLVHPFPRSGIDTFGRWVGTHDWFTDFGFSSSVDDLASSFTTQLVDAINRIFPVKTIKLHATDKPWITPDLKLMMKDRQKAFTAVTFQPGTL